MKGKTITAMAALVLLGVLASGGVLAHGGPDRDDRRGMMGGYGGYGMGPGMMGGQGMGPGMMGHGMGPGMMGPGMMGPGMMGPGMMGGIGPYAAGVLGLSDEQRQQLEAIQRDNAREHWQLMQELRERRHAMMDLYREGRVDPEEVGRAWEGMATAQRRMLEQRARMHNQMREVLTEEQRERLEEMRRYRYPDSE